MVLQGMIASFFKGRRAGGKEKKKVRALLLFGLASLKDFSGLLKKGGNLVLQVGVGFLLC